MKIGTRHIVIILLALLNVFVLSADNNVMENMCKRLFPGKANDFVFETLKANTRNECYEIESVGEKIVVRGTDAVSMSVGLNRYLKEYCNVHISWNLSNVVEMPKVLPSIKGKIKGEAKCDNRFFLNYCTFGYSMPYWKWQEWEHFIDWMALNGVTMPLAITGQESVWYKVWRKLGLSDSEIMSYFTGPAHLPWHRMSNVDYWQSPLPKTWLKMQEKLQKRILAREREFSMTPVLPAFSGHVPGELKKCFPEANIVTMSKWGGFDEKYRSHFLSPADPLFDRIQKLFIEEQTKLFGTNHIYGIDPFNEVDSPDWSEEYLSEVSRKIYNSISSIDAKAVWLQMTWMFYYEKEKWTQPRIKAFLNAMPDNKLILLDYFCDKKEIWKDTEKYYGKPYYWCYLGNFGGNTMIVGDLKNVDSKIDNLFENGGENVAGIGVTLEGLDVNPVMYEYVLGKAWNDGLSSSDWMEAWTNTRGGKNDTHIRKAWKLLADSIYIRSTAGSESVLMNARPTLYGVDGWNNDTTIAYDNKVLWSVWNELLQAKCGNNSDYQFDIVNVGRQVLGNMFLSFRSNFTKAYEAKDVQGAKLWAGRISEMFDDVDRLLKTNENFSLGRWLYDAKSISSKEGEKRYFEENARTIVTIWGQKGSQLNDYANRSWSGLMKDFYKKRWDMFTSAVIEALESEEKFDETKCRDRLLNFEYEWTKRNDSYDIKSDESPVTVANELYNKYLKYLNTN